MFGSGREFMAKPLSGRDREGTVRELLRVPQARIAMPASQLPAPACPLRVWLVPCSPVPGTGWETFWGVQGGIKYSAASTLRRLGAAPLCCLYRHSLTRRPLLPAPGRCGGGRVPEPAAEGSVPADQLNPGDDEHRRSRAPARAGTWRSRWGAVPRLRPARRAVPEPAADAPCLARGATGGPRRGRTRRMESCSPAGRSPVRGVLGGSTSPSPHRRRRELQRSFLQGAPLAG